MNIEEILNSPDFGLPILNTTGSPYSTFLNDKLDAYSATLNNSSDIYENFTSRLLSADELISKVHESSSQLTEIVSTQRKGQHASAILMFDEFMKKNKKFLFSQATVFNANAGMSLYRAKNDNVIKPQDHFFHGPFQLSPYIGATRYAFAGQPTLYLANSIVVAYLETRTTDISTFQAVRLVNKIPLSLLNFDFTSPPKELKSLNPIEYEKQVTIKALLYPLYLTCYTINSDETAVAPLEYLIPQLFNHWLREYRFSLDGIRFSSTKVHSDKYQNKFYNIIIPPKQFPITGHCPFLKNIFEMSDVCAWTRDESAINQYFSSSFKGDMINEDVIQVESSTGDAVKYCNCDLGRMEYFMKKNLPAVKINF